MTASRRTLLGTCLAAATLGAALAAPAGAAVAGPPEDQVSMACSAVKNSSDPGAAAALRLYGFEPEDVKGEVGFFCVASEDPSKTNFCAIANQKDSFLAIGKAGACTGGETQAPAPVAPPPPA